MGGLVVEVDELEVVVDELLVVVVLDEVLDEALGDHGGAAF